MSETLDPATKTVDNSLRMEIHPNGYRIIYRGDSIVCDDGDSTVLQAGRFALAIRSVRQRGTVAHVGGGFCVLPRILGPGYTHTIYELEPRLERFAPQGTTFISGNYTDTMNGRFDVICFDANDSPDVALLQSCLSPGGLLLGV